MTAPADRRARTRRLVKLLVVVDVVVFVAVAAVWLALQARDEHGNVVNAGLRGSKPPAGQELPDLRGVAGIEPAFPSSSSLRGDSLALVATCMVCRSGDILGGYLGRLSEDDVPEGAALRVVAWDGDARAWRARWRIVDSITIHAVPKAQTASVRRTFGIGPVDGAEESGMVFVYDTRGRWRSTYFLGQVDREDIRHDLEVLVR